MDIKYHISKKGVAEKCNAKKRQCPLGEHFSSLKEAEDFADKMNENKSESSLAKEEIQIKLKKIKENVGFKDRWNCRGHISPFNIKYTQMDKFELLTLEKYVDTINKKAIKKINKSKSFGFIGESYDTTGYRMHLFLKDKNGEPLVNQDGEIERADLRFYVPVFRDYVDFVKYARNDKSDREQYMPKDGDEKKFLKNFLLDGCQEFHIDMFETSVVKPKNLSTENILKMSSNESEENLREQEFVSKDKAVETEIKQLCEMYNSNTKNRELWESIYEKVSNDFE